MLRCNCRWSAVVGRWCGLHVAAISQWLVLSLLAAWLAILSGCGTSSPSSGGQNSQNPPASSVSVTISPLTASLAEGASQQFSATVTGSSNTSVTWTASGGTISATGLYVAGNSTGNFTVTATSVADTSKTAPASVAITAPGSNPSPGTATSITKDGVTWTFSAPVPVGQFVNGDYYVVGPVTITAISPEPTTSSPYMNGSVKNLPTANGKSGFDSRLNDGTDESWWFDATLRSYPPIALNPGDALVSSISLPTIHSVPEVMRASDMSASPVASASVLTVLSSAPPADAFRPSYCDRSQTIYRAGNLQRNLLPSVAPPNPANTPTLAQYEALYRRPWIDTNAFLFDAPADYMPSYGQHIAFADSYAGLLLMLNFPADQKVNLTNYLVQYGIDLYGCVQAGYGWPAFGGHRSGRKFPIILAGILLNDSGMENVSANHPDQFGEDMQTLYIQNLPPVGTYTQAWQGATVIYGGHYGVHADGTPVSPGLYGPYEQLQPSSWPILTPPGEQLGEAYRRCCTSVSWVGEALAIHLLNGESTWNYPPFFDYVYRWMMEDDTQAVAEIKAQTGFDYSASWERQGQTQYWLDGEVSQPTFIDDMWLSYHW
ncbi:MAG TPA: Ig-like domain-containing protein [Candidatus Eremiobacteraceae bacterium]|nr:Ig-like domain-containing protein [Candidatus Eremiobacteraceae bacterium]